MPVFLESNKLKIECTNPEGCVMTAGDIWCIVGGIGRNGYICPHLQLGIDNTQKDIEDYDAACNEEYENTSRSNG